MPFSLGRRINRNAKKLVTSPPALSMFCRSKIRKASKTKVGATMKKLFVFAAAFSVLLLAFSVDGFAQAGNAAVTGTVEDPSKALIPGVMISATDVATGVVTTAITNESGAYNIPSLLPGTYKLTAELPGFRGVTFNNVALSTNETKRFNFTLEVASQATNVDVTIDATALLTTSSATIGEILPEYKTRELPLVGNNVLDLISVMGGARVSALGGTFTTFAGISAAYVNTTVNGQSVNDGRYEAGVYGTTRINPDLVSEVRLVLAPVDAELGRGNGQVQIQTRSGTNKFRGTAVWDVRNSALDARSWLDNRTVPRPTRNWANQNQYTVSFGGPIIKNKTFFFGLVDGQIAKIRENTNATVLTDCARNGIFRFFPDWNNGSYNSAATPFSATPSGTASTPVVDSLGNPVAPAKTRTGAAYTGTLQYLSVFGRLNLPAKFQANSDCSNALQYLQSNTPWDTNRTQVDTSGFVKKILGQMPRANAWDGAGIDGLNTAVFRWTRPRNGNDDVSGGTSNDTERKQVNIRIDHNLSTRHKLFGNWQYERDWVDNSGPAFPTGFWGSVQRRPMVITSAFTSTLSSTLVNEARVSVRRNFGKQYEAFDDPTYGKAAKEFFPKINGLPVIVGLTLGGGMIGAGDFTRGNTTTLWTYGDTVSWTKGKHAFKVGAEFRPADSTGFSNLNYYPHANGGAGNFPFPIFSNNVSGMLTSNSGTMDNVLSFLSGSVGSLTQLYFLSSAQHLDKYDDLRTSPFRGTDFRQNEMSWFAKDDWKVRSDVTLNLGLRYEYYGSPWEARGLTPAPIGGGLAAFGYSGRSFNDWFAPGQRGDATAFEFVGPNTPNPGKSLWKADRNNFGPAVGFAWQVPYFGKGKTTVRGGYQITYQGGGRSFNLDLDLGYAPGMIFTPNLTADPTTFTTLADLSNSSACAGFGCLPVPNTTKPMQPIPNTYRATIAGWSGFLYDPNYVSPYVQNFNLGVTRSLRQNMTLEVRYIGTRGLKLFDTLPLNSRNYLTNGLKDAFDAARAGGESALLDKMFNGINVAGAGYGPVGTMLNGVLQTGAMHLRATTTGNIQSMLANGNYSGLAGALNTLNYNKTFTGNGALPDIPLNVNGAVLRYNNFPENFISANPQFSSIGLRTNLDTSHYHGLQAQYTLRPTLGFNYTGTFTWSKSTGSPPNGGFADPRNRSEYGVLFGHRTLDFRSNGTLELPIGPGKLLLKNSSGWLSRLVEKWSASAILQMTSGRPNTIGAQAMLLQGTGTPVITPEGVAMFGNFPSFFGHVDWPDGALAGNYFPADTFFRVPDPQCNSVTPAQNLNGLTGLNPVQRCTLQALARPLPAGKTGVIGQNGIVDIGTAGSPRAGVIVLRNALPGERGTLGLNTMEGPGLWFLDAAMSKTVRINETKSIQMRVDAKNLLNHPTPDDPGIGSCAANVGTNLTLNSNSPFGQIGGKCVAESAARRFQASLRFSF